MFLFRFVLSLTSACVITVRKTVQTDVHITEYRVLEILLKQMTRSIFERYHNNQQHVGIFKKEKRKNTIIMLFVITYK